LILELGLEVSDFSIKETLLSLSALGNLINTDQVAFGQLVLVDLAANIVQQIENSTKLVRQPMMQKFIN
jgi:hypothetical protein